MLIIDSQDIRIVSRESGNVRAVVRLDICHAKKVAQYHQNCQDNQR